MREEFRLSPSHIWRRFLCESGVKCHFLRDPEIVVRSVPKSSERKVWGEVKQGVWRHTKVAKMRTHSEKAETARR